MVWMPSTVSMDPRPTGEGTGTTLPVYTFFSLLTQLNAATL